MWRAISLRCKVRASPQDCAISLSLPAVLGHGCDERMFACRNILACLKTCIFFPGTVRYLIVSLSPVTSPDNIEVALCSRLRCLAISGSGVEVQDLVCDLRSRGPRRNMGMCWFSLMGGVLLLGESSPPILSANQLSDNRFHEPCGVLLSSSSSSSSASSSSCEYLFSSTRCPFSSLSLSSSYPT
jgi:hypothetical protein